MNSRNSEGQVGGFQKSQRPAKRSSEGRPNKNNKPARHDKRSLNY